MNRRLLVLLVTSVVAGQLAACSLPGGRVVEITIRYSRFSPEQVSVPVGVPLKVVLRNDDPIDHEWIVGDEQVHVVHRVGTEPLHAHRPTEIFLPALEWRTTVVTFEEPGAYRFICHLPAHEAYGMTGVVSVTP